MLPARLFTAYSISSRVHTTDTLSYQWSTGTSFDPHTRPCPMLSKLFSFKLILAGVPTGLQSCIPNRTDTLHSFDPHNHPRLMLCLALQNHLVVS